MASDSVRVLLRAMVPDFDRVLPPAEAVAVDEVARRALRRRRLALRRLARVELERAAREFRLLLQQTQRGAN